LFLKPYPFGMLMPGRTFSSSSHRYGFNGKENDNEVKGEGNQQDYGMRIYDPRVARFLSIDPLAKDYPWYTAYQFASNNPIAAIDLDGLEAVVVVAGNTAATRENARGQYFMYQVKIYENLTLDQYREAQKNGKLEPPTATALLSRDGWQKPGTPARSRSRYGALNETPPGTYYMEYSKNGYGSKGYKIKISDEKGKDVIDGPDGKRSGVRVHQYSPHDACGCLTTGSGRDTKPVEEIINKIPSLKEHKEVRLILENRPAEYNEKTKTWQGVENKEIQWHAPMVAPKEATNKKSGFQL
jgi:RHS repeat-associated protein